MREPGVLPRLGIDDGGGDTKAIATAVLMRTLDAEFTAYEEYMNARIAKEETKDIYGDPLHYLRPRNVPAVPGALPGNPLRYAHWLQRGVIDPARPDLCQALKDKCPIVFAIARSVSSDVCYTNTNTNTNTKYTCDDTGHTVLHR